MILTKTLLLVAKVDSNVVSEFIPLHQIDRVTMNAIVDPSPGSKPLGDEDEVGRPKRFKQLNPVSSDLTGKQIFAFQIFMKDDSVFGNRSFSFRTVSKKDMDDWVKHISTVAERAKRTYISNHPELDSMLRLRLRCKVVYKSITFQTMSASLILLNFIMNLIAAEEMPQDGSTGAEFYNWLDQCFLIIFVGEMLFIIFIYQDKVFRSGWRIFDILVIFLSFVFTFVVKAKFQVLRLVRVFRVIKSFRMLQSFRLIINALSNALFPVFSAFTILILIMSIYAVMAVDLFGEKDPAYFGNLSRALFTIFQITTGDSWTNVAKAQMPDFYGGIEGEEVDYTKFDRGIAFFFVSTVSMRAVRTTSRGLVSAVGLDLCTHLS